MALSLELDARAKVRWTYEDAGDISTPADDDSLTVLTELTHGAGDGQVNRMYRARRTVTLATGTDLLDLSGSLLGQFGNTVILVELKVLLIVNRGEPDGAGSWTETPGQDLLIGGAGAGNNAIAAFFNGDQDAKLTLRSGGILLLTAPNDGYTVLPGSQDVLQIDHDGSEASGGDIEYDIVLAGAA